jgi:hypothetical protein
MIEMKGEVFEEIALVRVVTVAQHHLSSKMLPVVL